MNNENKLPEDPSLAEPGKGAPGNDHYAVQTAQTTAVNPPDTEIPGNTPTELSKKQVNALEEQEDGNMPTTEGYVVDESGRLDNLPVEPPMRVEGE